MYIVGDSSLNTLLHLKYHTTWRAARGAHGGGKKKSGASAEDVTIPVPLGTLVWRRGSDGQQELVEDIGDTEPVLVCRGGSGGAGNARFVSSVNQEPVLAQQGEAGEEAELLVELKLLADVGIVGRPNAGKSTLLARCSAAKPKIAAYPFTTTDPILGVVDTRNSSYVMMEVPGLIEGAHTGAGLGQEFLRHAERARLLVHLLDGLSEDPREDWRRTNHELASFDLSLGRKPQVVVVNKLDIPELRQRAPEIERQLSSEGIKLLFVSAATGEGVEAMLGKILEELNGLPRDAPKVGAPQLPGASTRKPGPINVSREGDAFVIRAAAVERMVPSANLRDWRVMIQIWKELDRAGVVKALEEMGVKPGDTVRLGGVDLEWY